MSDQDRISRYDINTISSRIVMRLEKNINKEIISWLNTKFFEWNLKNCMKYSKKNYGKISAQPHPHYAFSSWIEKTMTKTIHCHGKTDLFNNSMGLCGNFTRITNEILAVKGFILVLRDFTLRWLGVLSKKNAHTKIIGCHSWLFKGTT